MRYQFFRLRPKAALAPTRPEKARSFFWQGMLLILPMVVLVLISFASMRQDERRAEEDARKRAAENVRTLARSIRAFANEDLLAFTRLQFHWPHELRLAAMPYVVRTNRAAGIEFPPRKLAEEIADWEKKYPQFKLADSILPQGALLADGTIREPAFIEVRPPDWFVELSAVQRELWEEARRLDTATANIQALESASKKFLASDPPREAQLAAEFLVLAARTRSDPSAANTRALFRFTGATPLESGVPLRDLALFQAMHTPQDFQFLHREIFENVTQRPSLLSPLFLDRLESLTNNADQVTCDQVRLLRELWNRNAVLQDWMRAVRESNALDDATAFWTTSVQGEALTLCQPVTFVDSVTNRGFHIRILPRELVEAVFRRALSENEFMIPAYAGVALSVSGKTLIVPADLPANSAHNELLARTEQQLTSGLPAFEAALQLIDRGKLLAAERRRNRLLLALIGGTSLVALAGLLTARRAFYRQLRLNELKSNFVSSVSHELRAPIASVRLMAESLERGKIHQPEKQREYFGFITRECRRLSSLIENVLDFSRIEQGRKEYEFEPADIVRLFSETVKLMEPYAAERQVKLALQLDSQLSTLNLQPTIDGRAVQQALVNLIDNAIKHSPHGTEVMVTLRTEAHPDGTGECVLFAVQDRGPGIPRDQQEKIFERFHRLGSELRRETQGVGIGLSIVKHIVDAHGGRVRVESEPGKGSRFEILLPVEPAK